MDYNDAQIAAVVFMETLKAENMTVSSANENRLDLLATSEMGQKALSELLRQVLFTPEFLAVAQVISQKKPTIFKINDGRHKTILHHVAKSLPDETVMELLETDGGKTCIGEYDEYGHQAAYYAWKGFKTNSAKQLDSLGETWQTASYESGRTVLSIIMDDNADALRFFISKGLNANGMPERDINQDTWLHYSAIFGAVKCCTLLLDNAADPFSMNIRVKTPLSVADPKTDGFAGVTSLLQMAQLKRTKGGESGTGRQGL